MRPGELERARRSLSLTQAQAGFLLGVHKISISKWERGVVEPGRGSLSRVEALIEAAVRRPGIGPELISLLDQGKVEEAQMLLEAVAHPRVPQEIDPASEAALVKWADSPGSAAELELLVKRLLAETGVPVVASDASEPGYDAVVEGHEGDSIVPAGDSVWEVSTRRDVESKAKEDLEKRSSKPQGVEPHNTTFVFVTPRRWRGGKAWAEKQRKLGGWKAIRVLDATILSAWLWRCPATRIWFAERTGARVDGLWSVDAFLQRTLGFLTIRTGGGHPWQVAVAGRKREVERLAEWVERDSSDPLYVQGLRVREVSIFVAAALRGSLEDRPPAAAHRAVVAGSLDAWERIAQVGQGLVLVPDFEADPGNLIAASGRHKVVVPLEPSGRPPADVLRLGKLGEVELRSALEATGIPELRASELARTERAGVTTLLQAMGGMRPPAWVTEVDSALRTLALVGAFEEDSEADRRVVAALSDQRWHDLLTSCHGWTRRSDSPLAEATKVWRWTSRSHRWLVLGESFDADGRIERAVDLAFALEPGTDARAGTEPATLTLREGLAELLARVANPELGTVPFDLRSWLDRVVTRLFGAADRPWQVLSMIVEASPDVFLSHAEGARGDEHEIVWALEKLAWTEDWFPRAIRALLAMAAREGAERATSCAAFRGLQHIFTAWSPQTVASAERRLDLLESFSKLPSEDDDVHARLVATLLLDALPDAQWSQDPTQRPRYLGQEALARYAPPTRFEIHRFGERLEKLILERAESNRWVAHELLRRYHLFRNPEPAIALLRRRAWSDDDRVELVSLAREALAMGIRARWGEAQVEAAQGLVRDLEPDGRVESVAWLFSSGARLPDADPKTWHEELERRRGQAMAGLLEDADMAVDRIRRLLACRGVAPMLVGQSLGRADLDARAEHAIIELGPFPGREVFHAAFFGARQRHLGEDWLLGMLPALQQQGDVAVLSSALLGLPPSSRKTWEIARSLGDDVERAYWRRLGVPYGVEGVQDVEIAASRLLWAGMPWAALELAGMMLHTSHHKAPMVLAPDLLVRIVASVIEDGREPSSMEEHYIERCLEALLRSDLPSFEVEALEWRVLESGWHVPPMSAALERKLGEDPGFVVEVLEMLWQPDNGSEAAPKDESDENRGRAAYGLLRQWEGVPGWTGQRLDEARLARWIRDLRARAREAERVEAAEHLLGEVLARVPPGVDGQWPHEIAREVLEQSKGTALRDSLMVAKINARGVFSKSLDEGGRQERAIAEGLFQGARRLEPRWPRTAEVLRDLGRHYLAYAEHWDRDAARRDG